MKHQIKKENFLFRLRQLYSNRVKGVVFFTILLIVIALLSVLQFIPGLEGLGVHSFSQMFFGHWLRENH